MYGVNKSCINVRHRSDCEALWLYHVQFTIINMHIFTCCIRIRFEFVSASNARLLLAQLNPVIYLRNKKSNLFWNATGLSKKKKQIRYGFPLQQKQANNREPLAAVHTRRKKSLDRPPQHTHLHTPWVYSGDRFCKYLLATINHGRINHGRLCTGCGWVSFNRSKHVRAASRLWLTQLV